VIVSAKLRCAIRLLALGTEAFFKSQQRRLGQERACIAALCAIGCRTDRRRVFFRGLGIKVRQDDLLQKYTHRGI
jgi:hypothetical protein